MQEVFFTSEKPQGRRVGLSEMPANVPMLLDAKQAAAIASTSPASIRRMCRQGTIKCVMVGNKWRINRDALLEQFGLVEKVG